MKSEAAKIRDLYERHAYQWDQDRGRDLFEQPWLDRFLNLAPPGKLNTRRRLWFCGTNCSVLHRARLQSHWCGLVTFSDQNLPTSLSARALDRVRHARALPSSIGATPSTHGSLDAAEYRQLLNDHGFAVLEHMVHDPTCGHHTIWLAQLR